jgi:hypothetical protein
MPPPKLTSTSLREVPAGLLAGCGGSPFGKEKIAGKEFSKKTR